MPARPPKSKLYTRTGDRGQTSLFGGRRVAKDDLRVAAYGTIDELNSFLGLAAATVRQRAVAHDLRSIQNELFNIGAELASEKPVRRAKGGAGVLRLQPASAHRLEQLIDRYDARVPPLRTFILPGGTQAAALLHVARTACRRAERELVALSRREAVNPAVLAYVNRLCDLLFALARYVNKAARRPEVAWRKDGE
jgi:cob(I)alamin adenosyltransferase